MIELVPLPLGVSLAQLVGSGDIAGYEACDQAEVLLNRVRSRTALEGSTHVGPPATGRWNDPALGTNGAPPKPSFRPATPV
jgi:hypothetical protein